MLRTFSYPARLIVAATRPSAASCCAGVRSPSFTPLRSVAPDCMGTPVGRLDQRVLCSVSKLTVALARLSSPSDARKALAAETALAVASAGEAAGRWVELPA